MPQENIQYIIKDDIVFNVLDNTFWSKHHPSDVLTIGLVPSRLLRYLLENAGRTVSKDELLSQVWDAYGLRSSGHSLNQNISLLRKSFVSLGCTDDIICTFPRIGYIINGDLVSINHEVARPAGTKLLPPEKKPRVPAFSLMAALLTFAILTVVAVLVYRPGFTGGAPPQIPVQHIMPMQGFNECRLYTTKPGLTDNVRLTAIARALIDEETCDRHSLYIIAADEPALLAGGSGRVFLTHCQEDVTDKTLIGCNSVYERSYSEKK